MKVSILVCSFFGSRHFSTTVKSILDTFPVDKYDMELLFDIEATKTGLANTANRYTNLFKRSTGDIIVKSDDDAIYFKGWFDHCYEALKKDGKIGYIGAISRRRMLRVGNECANPKDFPIEPVGKHNYEEVVSGLCWVFKRKLWIDYPYSLVANTWKLDGTYSKLIKTKGMKIAAINGALVGHLGQDRYKSITTDQPGKLPSEEFKAAHSEENFKIF